MPCTNKLVPQTAMISSGILDHCTGHVDIRFPWLRKLYARHDVIQKACNGSIIRHKQI